MGKWTRPLFIWYWMGWKIENSIGRRSFCCSFFSFRNRYPLPAVYFLVSFFCSPRPLGPCWLATPGLHLRRHMRTAPPPRTCETIGRRAASRPTPHAPAYHRAPPPAAGCPSRLHAGPQSQCRPSAWLTPTRFAQARVRFPVPSLPPHTTARRRTPFDLVGWTPSLEAEAAGAARASSSLQQGQGVPGYRF
jgi:hypothetical protein